MGRGACIHLSTDLFRLQSRRAEQLHQGASLFAHNHFNVLSLRDADYLHGQPVPIRQQLGRLLPAEQADEYTLLTSPRYLGYAFNPVNFHLRLSTQGELRAAVAEVNNTFGDRHVYPLCSLQAGAANTWTARCPKCFHVSPFNDRSGEYRFTFRIRADQVHMGATTARTCTQTCRGSCQPLTIPRFGGMHYATHSTPLEQYADIRSGQRTLLPQNPVHRRPHPTWRH